MSEEGKNSKGNDQSNSENDGRSEKNQRKESETEESEKDIEKQKSRTKNPAENAKLDPEKRITSEYDEKSSSGSSKISAVDRDEGSEEKKTRRSHLYLLQESSPSAKRTCHQPPETNVNVKARKKLIIASFLCVFFILVTIVGGVLSNSLAVAADAAHTMTDFAGFMISLFAIWLAGRKPTERLSFGWYRAEVIGALVSVMSIWCVTAVLVWLAIQRCINPDFEIDTIIMMITAVFGIVTNIILGIQLSWGSIKTERSCDVTEIGTMGHQNRHQHHHESWLAKLCKKVKCSKKNPETRQTIAVECQIDPSEQDNINIRTAILHVVTDALQSVGVLAAAIVIYFRPDWIIADPICTFLFAILVMFSTFKIMKDIGLVLMEGTPKFVDFQEVQKILESIEGVKSVHNLRIWALNVNRIALSVHLVAYQNMDPASILRNAEKAIHRRYHLYETTIQVEEEGEHE